MAVRGALYRCHLFSFGGPQSGGVFAQWTRDFEPVNDFTEPRAGQLFELYCQVDRSLLPEPLAARIRFDILEEDVFDDDVVVALVGPGAQPIDSEWPVSHRILVKVSISREISAEDAARMFRRNHERDFFDCILIIEQEEASLPYHIVTWWLAESPDDSGKEAELYFILNVQTASGEFDDQSERTLDVPGTDRVASEIGVLTATLPSAQDEDLELQAPLPLQVSDPVLPGPDEGREWLLSAAEPDDEQFLALSEPLPAAVTPTTSPPPAPPVPQEGVTTTTQTRPTAAPPGCPDDIRQRFLRRPPSADRSGDRTIFGDPANHGEVTVAIVHGFIALRIQSQPHPITFNMVRALNEGRALYRTVGFVILEGPLTLDDSRRGYHVLPLSEPLTVEELDVHRVYREQRIARIQLYYYGAEVKNAAGESYILRTIVTSDDRGIFDTQGRMDVWDCELAVTDAHSPDAALSLAAQTHIQGVFQITDQKLAADQREGALEEIRRLGSTAFELASSSQRRDYLNAFLSDWWLSERDSRSVREIILSATSPEEIVSHVDFLRQQRSLDRLVGNLNGGVFSFLSAVGGRFEKDLETRFPFSLDEVVSWITDQSSRRISIPILPPGVPGGLSIDRETGQISFDLHALEELQTALTTFVRFVVSTVQDLYMLISRPDKIIDAVGQLMEFLVTAELAKWGHRPSQRKMQRIRDQIARHVKHLYLAIRLLNLEVALIRQVRWAILWEIASMFIGIGEIRAAVSATRGAIASSSLTRRAAAMGRIAEVVGEGERAVAALDDTARLMARSMGTEPDLALRAISDLPQGQLGRLGAAVAESRPAAARTLTQLAETAPTSTARQVINESADMVKTALATENKVGRRLQDNARDGLRRLFDVEGLAPADIRRILGGLDGPAVERFLISVGRMLSAPVAGAATVSRLTPALIGQLAKHPRVLQFALRYEQSPAALLHLLEDAAGNMHTVERATNALESVLWGRTDRSRRTAQQLIDRMAAKEPGSVQEAVDAVSEYLRASGRTADAERLAAQAADASRDLRIKLGQALRERARHEARTSVDGFMGRLAAGDAAALNEVRNSRLASSVLAGDPRVGAVVNPHARSLVEQALSATSETDLNRAMNDLRQLMDQDMPVKVRAALADEPAELTPELAHLRRQIEQNYPALLPGPELPKEVAPYIQPLSDVLIADEMSNLSAKLASTARARVEAVRIGQKINPADVLPGNSAGQRLLGLIDAEGWESIVAKCDEHLPSFRQNSEKGVSNVAGQLREELMFVDTSFGRVMERARRRAARMADEGVRLREVRLMRLQGGQSFGKMKGTSARSIQGEKLLTDGIIGGIDQNGNLHVLAVYESKSMTNVGDLFPSADFKINGQILEDIERIDATAIRVDDVWFDFDKIVVGRRRTEWVVAIPPDKKYPSAGLERLLRESGFKGDTPKDVLGELRRHLNLTTLHHPLDDKSVKDVTRSLLNLLDGIRP